MGGPQIMRRDWKMSSGNVLGSYFSGLKNFSAEGCCMYQISCTDIPPEERSVHLLDGAEGYRPCCRANGLESSAVLPLFSLLLTLSPQKGICQFYPSVSFAATFGDHKGNPQNFLANGSEKPE